MTLAVRCRWRAGLLVAVALGLPAAVLAQAPADAAPATPAPAPALPSFAELEAAGARIGEIQVRSRDIFDTRNPKEDKLLFRWANALHIQTRPGVIERALLFKSGELLSLPLIEETERVLRSNRFLYDVQIRPLAWRDGVVDIEVETRDTWSLDPGISAGRSGGATTSGIQLKDYNLLGSGIAVGIGRSSGVDRSSTEFNIANERAFGGSTSLSYSLSSNSDGRRDAAAVAHPYYGLDTPWAAGISAARDNRIDAVYNAGNIVAEYRHRQNVAEAFGGWSTGRVDGWVQRLSLGVSLLDDRFAFEPGLTPPAQLPADEKLVAPFVRVALIEDRFEKQQNRNLIGRPEFFALGLIANVQLGWASTRWGSSRDALLYSGTISQGFEPTPEQRLITSATLAGQFSDGRVRRQRLGGAAQYYLPQGPRWLFYAGASVDLLTRPETNDTLLLGGDNGLRGYPLRYQSGDRRALFTVEERTYTDVFLWQLFRVGAAGYVDVGRAWGGDNVNTLAPGWLASAGFGLRIVSVRAAFSNVLHIDLAFPLDADVAVKKLQFLVKTKASF
jgi:hypothetical protein